ncbi:MAG: leucyl/phenylalanyl-tRNA--protein transferase [Phycisphaerae bacterium]|nr:leucyl/phenylalanyl-tRNA--protein transferase [Tepidisphaeraceae bacterium]
MRLDVETLLGAYRQGAFPMAEGGDVRFYTADPRGVLPLHDGPGGFHVPRTLRQVCRRGAFEIRINTSFRAVMTACGDRTRTWINSDLVEAFCELHARGHAHSVEAWQDGMLAGGLYGVQLGAAFSGESMFHLVPDASKVAMVALVERLRARGFELLDAQTCNANMKRFGCVEIPHAEYMGRLRKAMGRRCEFG